MTLSSNPAVLRMGNWNVFVLGGGSLAPVVNAMVRSALPRMASCGGLVSVFDKVQIS